MRSYVLVAEAVETKHLPGQHNQQTHGHRYSHNPARLLARGASTTPRRALRRASRGPSGPGARSDSRQQISAARRARKARRPATPPLAELPTENITVGDLAKVDLSGYDMDRLAELVGRCADADAAEQVLAEIDRRDDLEQSLRDAGVGDDPPATAKAQAEEWAAFDEHTYLNELGEVMTDAQAAANTAAWAKHKKSPTQQAQDAWPEFAHARFLQAEEATNGHMLNAKGKAAEISAAGFFDGTVSWRDARKYASEDLLRYLADHPLVNKAQFIAQYRGNRSAGAAGGGPSYFSEHG